MSRSTQRRTNRIVARLLAGSTVVLTSLVVAASRAAALVPQPDPIEPGTVGTVTPQAAASSTSPVLWILAALLLATIAVAVALRVRHGRRRHGRAVEAQPDRLPAPIG